MERRKKIRFLMVLAALFVLVFCLSNLSALSGAVSTLFWIFLPLLLGLAVAFVLNLPLRWLERLWIRRFGRKRHGLRRGVCILICLCLFGAVIALLLGAVLPRFWQTLDGLIGKIPHYIEQINGWWDALSRFLESRSFPFALPPLELDPQGVGDAVSRYMEENAHRLLDLSVGAMRTVLVVVFDSVVALVIALYILAQKEKLSTGAVRVLHSLFSEKTAGKIVNFARLVESVFSKFVTGQVTEALIIGALCFLGMMIFRMPYALLISMMVGVTALIPIFGAFLGTGVGAFLILLDDPIKAIWFVIFIIILQQLEGNLIYPRVVGKSVGLPGLWVLVAVTVGSAFGLAGMLVSVPLVSVGYCLLRQFVQDRLEEKPGDPEEELNEF